MLLRCLLLLLIFGNSLKFRKEEAKGREMSGGNCSLIAYCSNLRGMVRQPLQYFTGQMSRHYLLEHLRCRPVQ